MNPSVKAADARFVGRFAEVLVGSQTVDRSIAPIGIAKSEPNTELITASAAPLKVLCPDIYSGKGGVVTSGSHWGSAVVLGLLSVSAWRIAVTGRHKLYSYLASQQLIAASARAIFSRANNRALSSSDLPPRAEASWAIWFQWPGGLTSSRPLKPR